MSDNTAPNGIVLVDKPQGWTSFDVCAKMRSLLKTKKIGHAGTLDPMATGVMTVLVGGATKAADILPISDKRYLADFRLGIETDTLDITGTVVSEKEFSVKREELVSVLERFRGEIMQLPPMYSAVHKDGKRLYELARQGIEVEREARKINILSLELVSFDENTGEGQIDVLCSKGTYIRSLVSDIGSALGCGAVMTALRRTDACGFSIGETHTMEQICSFAQENTVLEHIISVDRAFEVYGSVNITPAQENRYKNGGDLMAERLKLNGESAEEGKIFRVYGTEFIGLGIIKDGSLRHYKRLT